MKLSTETGYKEAMANEIAQRWSSADEGFFSGVDGKRLAWMSLTGFNSDDAIIFLSGRRGSYLKYKELFWECTENGFDVFSYDHRGQGLSERIAGDIEVGHVEDFNDYVDDLEIFMQKLILPKKYKRLHLIANSMGGLIGSLYQQRGEKVFTRTILIAPMFGIYLSPLNRKWAMYFSKFLAKKASRPDYIVTKGPYMAEPFMGNPMTSSRVRYPYYDELCETIPQIKLGGPSPWWVYQGLKAGLHAIEHAQDIETPLILFRGSRDKVVENSAQDAFMLQLEKSNTQASLIEIQGAKHELLLESDEYRIPMMTRLFEFLKEYE